MERVLASLQARRIDRIAAGYAVGGWLLVQAAAIAMPSFNAPSWAMRALIIFVLLGFPCTLAIAWFATPQLQPHHAAHPHKKHLHVAALILFAGAAVFAVGALALQLSHLSAGEKDADVDVASSSIAVLPFVNMSGDPGKEFFSDGVSEELLNDLANVPALRVAARTSSFAFKGRSVDIKTIGRLLAVGAVLEGSVRESGAHLRITAQLIDAATGFYLWSAIYDRNLTDVLDVQDEIARAITAALTHKLLPPSKPGQRPGRPTTIDADAYRDYLKGLHEFAPRTEQGTEDALVLFEQVTARAPDFAEGYAALGRAMINMSEFHPERKDLLPAADAALARALALDPRCISALASRLDLSLHKLDWPAAGADAKRLQAINPNSATVLHEMFRYYQFLGFPELALAAAEGAAALNPLSFVDHLNAGVAYYYLGKYGEAAKAAHAALALATGQPSGLVLLCAADARARNLAEARAIELQLAPSPSAAQGCAFDIALGTSSASEARRLVANVARDFPKDGIGPREIGGMYAAAGDTDSAITWFARAYDLREIEFFTIRYDRTIPPELFAQAGWKTLTDRPLYQAWQSAHDRLANDLAGSRLAD